MILLYHKVDTENKSYWWVTADKFYRHMVQLSNKKVVYLDDYDPNNPDHVVITFDGVYTNILKIAGPILKKFGYPFELFVTSDYVGKKNEFDTVEPEADFAGEKELLELIKMGGRLQWHTKTHKKIGEVSEKDFELEMKCPDWLKKIDPKGLMWFGYAHGLYDDRSKEYVKNNYKGGLACDNGTYDDKTIWPRIIVHEDTSLIEEKVSLIIPCYNYAHFLVESIESALRQRYVPDEIILSDDFSTDHSLKIMNSYAEKYPELIKVNSNKKNLGIDKHFRKLLKISTGDIVMLLGADNRLPSNYLEEAVKAHISDPNLAVAYTDFILFGNRASIEYEKFNDVFKAGELSKDVYSIKFPDMTEELKKDYLTGGSNFIHGSSVYKKKAYDSVGGYPSRNQGPEDHGLFLKMIKKGWLAKKIPVNLEYRQHSADQANHQFAYFSELKFLRQQYKEKDTLVNELKRINKALASYSSYIEQIEEKLRLVYEQQEKVKKSKTWRGAVLIGRVYRIIRYPRTTIIKVFRKIKAFVAKFIH